VKAKLLAVMPLVGGSHICPDRILVEPRWKGADVYPPFSHDRTSRPVRDRTTTGWTITPLSKHYSPETFLPMAVLD
jgi:hypothetical protein